MFVVVKICTNRRRKTHNPLLEDAKAQNLCFFITLQVISLLKKSSHLANFLAGSGILVDPRNMSLLDLARACCEIAKIVNARITPEIVTEYRQNGCVVIRSLLRPDHIALLRAGIERNIQRPGPLLKVVTPPGLTSFFEDFRYFSVAEWY